MGIQGIRRYSLQLTALGLILVSLFACRQAPPPTAAEGGSFGFTINPGQGNLTLHEPEIGRLTLQGATAPGETRGLTLRELGITDISFEFKRGNELVIKAAFENKTESFDFLQPFFFTPHKWTTNIVDSTEPEVTANDLGGDGKLSPGEATSTLTFRVKHKGEPFFYLVDAHAAVRDAVSEEPSVVVLWNEAMLAAIRSGPPAPTVISRQLYLVHQAIYDAWSLYDARATPTVLDRKLRRPRKERSDANKAAAVSQAAYHTLAELFPVYERDTRAFSQLLGELGYEVSSTPDTSTPAGLGIIAARTVLASRAQDGSNAQGGYADTTSDVYSELYEPVNSAEPGAGGAPGQPGFDPNHWHPLRVPTGTVLDEDGYPVVDNADPASYQDQTFLTPHWGAVTPFALHSSDQFRPPAPPQLGSSAPYTDALGEAMTNDEAYRRQFGQVLSFSANLTDYHKCIAEYWADGPRTETPPGHWNALAHGISYRDRHTLDDDVKLYFALNGALFDASIAAWEAKRAYDFVRPVSAIRHLYSGQMVEAWAGPGLGTQTIPGDSWRPYQSLSFVTPPFPEYVSGHSTFSAAAAEVLTRYTGSTRFYDGVTVLQDDFNDDGVPDLLGQHIVPVGGNRFEASPSAVVVLQWETFQEAADEAALSRLYGGIHIQDGDRHGRRMGKQLGAQAYALTEQYWRGRVNP